MLRNMKIGTKLIFGFLFITLLLGIVGGIGTYSINNVQNRANSMYDDSLIPTNALSKVEANLLKIRLNVLYILDEDNKKYILQYEKTIKNLVSEDNELLDKYKNSNLSDIGKKQFDDLIEVLDNYREKRTEIIELAKEEKYEKALNSYNENIDIFDHISAKIDVLRNENLIQAENNNHKSVQLSANVIKVTLVITVIASAIAVCLGMYLSNTISKGINKVVKFAEIIGQGDLTQSISINSKDEIGKLAMAFEDTKDKLKELLYQINETANTVASNSQELMASTEETSQSLNQVVTTINEMAEGNSAQTEMITNSSEIITGVADSISEATKYTELSYNKAISSMEFVEKGKQAVGIQVDTSNSNKEISEKIEIAINELAGMADNIQSIVVEINAISEQTKLLSLNATIEAARAGENGRGFSVVADEIRKLSDRTAVSTHEISKIINSVNNKTSFTVTLVQNAIDVVNKSDMATKTTKNSFDKIALSVEDLLKVSTSTTKLLKEINSRSQEVKEQAINMSAVSEEASASMEELSATSEQQLATVETITNSASNLALLSQELMTHVSMFKLEHCDTNGNTEDDTEDSVVDEI